MNGKLPSDWRSRHDLFTSEMRAVRRVQLHVAALGANPLLTNASTKLAGAIDNLATWHWDGRPGGNTDVAVAEILRAFGENYPEPEPEVDPGPDYIALVFDGPPGPKGARFIEAHDANGQSIKIGDWVEVNDGQWELRMSRRPGEWAAEPAIFTAVEAPLKFDVKEIYANATQVGGNHYKGLPLEPWDLTTLNALNPHQHEICAYVQRYPEKGGVEDLKKARHWLDKLIEVETLFEQTEGYKAQRIEPTPKRVAIAILQAAIARLERP